MIVGSKNIYKLKLSDPQPINPPACYTTVANRNIKFPSSKEINSSNSKSDISKRPNIYDLKEEPKKSKRPVSAYVTNVSKRNAHKVSTGVMGIGIRGNPTPGPFSRQGSYTGQGYLETEDTV